MTGLHSRLTTQTKEITMPTATNQHVKELGQRFAEAQMLRDIDQLEALLTEDFKLVGPLGFVLDKQQWLAQYRSGALEMRSVQWDDVEVRDYGGVSVAIGRQTQEGSYQGQPANGSFRVTQIATQRDGRWLLVGLHFSPIAQPPPQG
jgi:ketosteroid isomerase-like protein